MRENVQVFNLNSTSFFVSIYFNKKVTLSNPSIQLGRKIDLNAK